MVWASACVGAIQIIFEMTALHILPLSIFIILLSTYPIFAAIITFLFQNKNPTKLEIISLISIIVGVLMISRPAVINRVAF